MPQKRNSGLDLVKISFKHKWLRKEFEKRANEMTYLFGKDIVYMGIRQYCYQRLDEQDRLRNLARAVQNLNE